MRRNSWWGCGLEKWGFDLRLNGERVRLKGGLGFWVLSLAGGVVFVQCVSHCAILECSSCKLNYLFINEP